MGYKNAAIKGISWISALRFTTRAMSLLRTAIIARLLSPSQFGLFAIATLVLTLVEVVTETGINTFLVQEKDSIKKYLNTAWFLSILRGLLISFIILLASPFIVQFFNAPNALELLLLVSLVPFIRGFINPAIISFTKELEFNKEFLYRSSIFLVETLVTIFLVSIYKSPTSLVYGLIIGAFYEVLISHYVLKIRPKFSFTSKYVTEILSRGKWVTGASIFDYLFYYGDNIVVGKMLNKTALGLYDMTYRISLLPMTEVGEVASRVMFPLLTKISHDKKRLFSAYAKVTFVIACITIPIGLILFFFAELIIQLLLGTQWLAAVPILKLLSIFGVIRSLTTPSGAVFLALKKQKYITVITFVGCVTLLSIIVPFIDKFGIVGAGLSAITASIIQIPFIGYYLIKEYKKIST